MLQKYKLNNVCTVLVLLTFFIMACSPASAYDILMFGDSITQGKQRNSKGHVYGVLHHPKGARVNGSYGRILETLLNKKEKSYVYNWGHSGERTSSGVNRIDTVLSSRNADYILILEGANDIINGISETTTIANLEIMTEKAIAKKVTPIISELTPMSCPYLCGRNTYAKSLNIKINGLAAQKNITLNHMHNDMKKGWKTVPYTSGDGLHISDAGYQLMAEKWYEVLLKEISPSISPILHLLLGQQNPDE